VPCYKTIAAQSFSASCEARHSFCDVNGPAKELAEKAQFGDEIDN
jgi:hypothetical protein